MNVLIASFNDQVPILPPPPHCFREYACLFKQESEQIFFLPHRDIDLTFVHNIPPHVKETIHYKLRVLYYQYVQCAFCLEQKKSVLSAF